MVHRMTRANAASTVIVGIDVETVNPKGAICEFAAVAIDSGSGAPVFSVASLVDPGDVEWSPITTSFHGIRQAHVAGKPRLDAIWREFQAEMGRVDSARMFAHNAAADRNWLTKGLGTSPPFDIECTMELAKRSIALPSYRLHDVCNALGVPFKETHRAAADATAAATVARYLLTGVRGEACDRHGGRIAASPPRAWTSNDARGRNRDILASTTRIGEVLNGHRVCITGQFACGWSRKDAKAVIVAHGGTPLDDVSGGCNLLVLAGRTDQLTDADFATAKARKARANGVRVISEAELRAMLGT